MPDEFSELEALAAAEDADPFSELENLSAGTMTARAAPAGPRETKPLPWYERAATGANDPILGMGQLVQSVVPDALLNAGRKVTDPILNAVLGGDYDTSNTSTEDFNKMIRGREGRYQQQREAAGQNGLDWWRVGGSVVNPMSWLGPAGEVGTVMQAVKAGAKTGAFQALLQPVTDEGSFLWDKAMQTVIGTAAGGALGGTLSGALNGLKAAFDVGGKIARRIVGGADEPTIDAAAAKLTDETLQAAGADPARMDPNLYGAIRQEVGDALKAGVQPDPKVMTNRADAAALPVPIDLTRGQAARDPMQFSWEINNSKLRGVGEPIEQRLTLQNRQLIENLNELGARNAPSTFDASQKIIGTIEGLDAQLKGKVDEAYSAVRDSAGRPALMDREAFQQAARQGLEHGQLVEYVPAAIQAQYNALATGKLPLTVDIAQQLDKVWGAEQRAAQGSAKAAIGMLRDALNKAPVSDALGEASMQAYKAARALAKQRFDMIDANPAYKAVVDGVEPDKFFQKYVQAANVSELGALKKLVGPEDTAMLQQTFLGNLKKAALNRASEENGVFSQSAYNKVIQDPVQGPRVQELFKENPKLLGQIYRLGRVAENIKAFPGGHSVNTSNTAPTAANLIRDLAKSEAGSALWNLVPGGQLVRHVQAEVREKAAAQKFVDESLNPGVTKEPLKPLPPPTQFRRLSDLAARGGAIAAPDEVSDERDH